MPTITLTIRLGPLVSFEVDGENCKEIAEALDGFGELNKMVEAMCSDLAERVYPDADKTASGPAATKAPGEKES
jgi:hypothetical protein